MALDYHCFPKLPTWFNEAPEEQQSTMVFQNWLWGVLERQGLRHPVSITDGGVHAARCLTGDYEEVEAKTQHGWLTL